MDNAVNRYHVVNMHHVITETSDCIHAIGKIMQLGISKEAAQALDMVLAEIQEIQANAILSIYNYDCKVPSEAPRNLRQQMDQMQYNTMMSTCKADDKSSELPNLKASQIQPKASETEKSETKHFIEVLPEDDIEDLKTKVRKLFDANYGNGLSPRVAVKLNIVADLIKIGLPRESQTVAFLKNMCRLNVSNYNIALDNPYSVETALHDQLKLNFSAKRVTQEIRDAHPDLSKSELIGFEDYVIGSMSAINILGSYTEFIGEYLKLAGK